MENIILIAVILLAVVSAASYIYRARKKGAHCVGCPHSGGKCSCSGGCAGSRDKSSVAKE